MRQKHIATGVSLWSNAIENEAALAATGLTMMFSLK